MAKQHISFYADSELVNKFAKALALEGCSKSSKLRQIMSAYADVMLTTNAIANQQKVVNRLVRKPFQEQNTYHV